MSDLFASQKIAASALSSNRTWMNTIANNIANAETVDTGTKGADGNYIPYSRQILVFEKVLTEKIATPGKKADPVGGVAVREIAEQSKVRKVYDPSHPAARKEGTVDAGYVYYPEVSVGQEAADMKIAAASYEANLTVMAISNKMHQQALQIGRR